MSERSWSTLPSPLLCSVAERLLPQAYARLRAICSLWESFLSHEKGEEGQQQPYYLPRSLHCPWLMVPSKDDEVKESITFLSLPESLQPYSIAAPGLRNRHVFGSHAGWLAVVDAECNICLINPLIRAQIPLPSITTIDIPGIHHVEVVRDPSSGSPIEFLSYDCNGIAENYTPDEFCLVYFRKIVLSSSPSSSLGDYIVVLIFHYLGYMAFARAGATAWTVLDRVPPKTYCYSDAVFVDRKLYAVAENEEIDAFDFNETEPQPRVVVGRISSYGTAKPRYLVHSSGDLLLVKRLIGKDILAFKTLGFTVEKLDLTITQEEKRRIPVKDLGCRSLFIGLSQSLSISTQEISGVRQNCIYYTDDNLDWFFSSGRQCTRDVGVFDIKEETCEPLYPPDTWLTWPPPIWLAPVLN